MTEIYVIGETWQKYKDTDANYQSDIVIHRMTIF